MQQAFTVGAPLSAIIESNATLESRLGALRQTPFAIK